MLQVVDHDIRLKIYHDRIKFAIDGVSQENRDEYLLSLLSSAVLSTGDIFDKHVELYSIIRHAIHSPVKGGKEDAKLDIANDTKICDLQSKKSDPEGGCLVQKDEFNVQVDRLYNEQKIQNFVTRLEDWVKSKLRTNAEGAFKSIADASERLLRKALPVGTEILSVCAELSLNALRGSEDIYNYYESLVMRNQLYNTLLLSYSEVDQEIVNIIMDLQPGYLDSFFVLFSSKRLIEIQRVFIKVAKSFNEIISSCNGLRGMMEESVRERIVNEIESLRDDVIVLSKEHKITHAFYRLILKDIIEELINRVRLIKVEDPCNGEVIEFPALGEHLKNTEIENELLHCLSSAASGLFPGVDMSGCTNALKVMLYLADDLAAKIGYVEGNNNKENKAPKTHLSSTVFTLGAALKPKVGKLGSSHSRVSPPIIPSDITNKRNIGNQA